VYSASNVMVLQNKDCVMRASHCSVDWHRVRPTVSVL